MESTDMFSAQWCRSDDGARVFLVANDQRIEVSALSIWEAQFEKSSIKGYKTNLPSEDIPDLKFSRFPLEIEILLLGSGLHDLSICFAVLSDHTLLNYVSEDQVILNDTWYFLDESVRETIEVLQHQGISVPGKINIGQLIWLKWKDRVALPVFDRTQIQQLNYPDHINSLPEINATFFPYQQSGVRFLCHIAEEGLGCILADEMGLGKTLQVIGLLAFEKQKGRGPNLVVCPATLLENWKRELNKFAPHLTVYIHAGSHRTGRPSTFINFDVVVVSYDTAVRDEVLFSSISWNTVALDEAQNIKNPDAQRTHAVKNIPRRNSVAVTGTPVENRLTDLWSISDFVLPDLLGGLEGFESSFDDNIEDASLLAPLVAPIILRRLVRDVAQDLPPRIDIDQVLTLPPELADRYEVVRSEIISQYGIRGSLVAIGKLRQFCAHPNLLGMDDGFTATDNPKYHRLVEVLEEIFEADEKVLIFTSYLGMSDLITNDLPKKFKNLWIRSIDGRVSIEMRQPLIDEFSAYDGAAAFVLNPIAAGTGLNITAANHVIHYNPEWNPALEDQASARAHRRTQTRPVTVHHFFYADTVEEVMMERLIAKRGIAKEAVTGHEGETDSSNIVRAMQISPLADRGD